MSRVRVDIRIGADAARVWAALEDIESHAEWMQDAEAIRFTSGKRRGVGTEFECDTKVGPLRVTDVMRVTEWDPCVRLAVRHSGIVTGEGRFTLHPQGSDTIVEWTEQLDFPTRLGGPIGQAIAKPIFSRLWKGNLRRLRDTIQANETGA